MIKGDSNLWVMLPDDRVFHGRGVMCLDVHHQLTQNFEKGRTIFTTTPKTHLKFELDEIELVCACDFFSRKFLQVFKHIDFLLCGQESVLKFTCQKCGKQYIFPTKFEPGNPSYRMERRVEFE